MSACRLHRIAAALPEVARAGDEAGLEILMGRVAGEREMRDLVRLLAAAADEVELAAVTGLGVPPKTAHREYERLRIAGRPIPEHIRQGDRAYHALRKREQRAARRAA